MNLNHTSVEDLVSPLIEWLQLGIEVIAALCVAAGVLAAAVQLFKRGSSGGYIKVRLTLAQFLVLALEFQLAADILSTAVAPSWDKIGQLAAIATIRTALNYFLMKEIKQEHAEIAERAGS